MSKSMVKCEHCNKEVRKDYLPTHIKNKHMKEKKVYTCDICNNLNDYKTASNLARHKNTHDKTLKIKCEHCNYSTSDKTNLEKHKLAHQKRIKCLICHEIILECDKEKHETTPLKTNINIPSYFKKENVIYNKHNNLLWKMKTRKEEGRVMSGDLKDLDNVYVEYKKEIKRNYESESEEDEEEEEEKIKIFKDETKISDDIYYSLNDAYQYAKEIDFPIPQSDLFNFQKTNKGRIIIQCKYNDIVLLKQNDDVIEMLDENNNVIDDFFYDEFMFKKNVSKD